MVGLLVGVTVSGGATVAVTRGEGEGGIGVDVGRGDGASVAGGVVVAKWVGVIDTGLMSSGLGVGIRFPLQPASRAAITTRVMFVINPFMRIL